MQGYRQLLVWQKAMDLVPEIYKLCASLPKDERFGLSEQMRRAVVSVLSNIAEGHGRESRKSFLYFLSVSLGSLAERHTQVLISERLGYLNPSDSEGICSKIVSLRKLLFRLSEKIRATEQFLEIRTT
jgi:four helix bundle protein